MRGSLCDMRRFKPELLIEGMKYGGLVYANEKFMTTKGEQIWDFIYAGDAARAFRLIAEKGVHGKVYLIGSGIGKPLREYIEVIGKETNPDVPIGFGKIPYGDKQVMHLCADITELTEDTGFVPQVSFEEGIRNTVEWVRRTIE